MKTSSNHNARFVKRDQFVYSTVYQVRARAIFSDYF